MFFTKSLLPVVAGLGLASAIDLDVNDPASIKTASSTVVYDMLKNWYTGNQSANSADWGTLPKPYYWWESGAMFGGLVDYSHYTGDHAYDDTIANAIISQASPTTDFMMLSSQAFDLGNDDILFWTLTAMNAAEYNFYAPANTSPNIYFDLGKNVFNLMTTRWNTTTCGGGLKWQFLPQNNGFYYKSTITNSAFFQVAARLGRMTGNSTYLDWANKVYNWMESVNYIDSNYFVYDGAGDAGNDNCKSVDGHQWSYNIASQIAGSAYMWNATGQAIWRNRTLGYLNAIKTNFVQPYANASDILYERCEGAECNTDQLSFKAYLAQCLGKAAVVMPEITPDVSDILKASAQAAAKTCTAGASGSLCGIKWYIGGSDGTTGVGQEMTAFETISSLLVWAVSGPVKRSDSDAPAPVSSSSSSAQATSTAASTSSSSTGNVTGTATASATAAASTISAPTAAQTEDDLGFLAKGAAYLPACACMKAQ